MEIKEAIEKAKNNDQKAFSFLLDTFWDDVYGFQLKRIENENDAEDITIQTISRAFDKIDSFNPEYKFKTWLITISKNIHIDLIRKRKKLISDQDFYIFAKYFLKIFKDRFFDENSLRNLCFSNCFFQVF